MKIAAKTGDTSEQVVRRAEGQRPRSPTSTRPWTELRADGTLKAISEKYFQTDVSPVKQ